MEKSLIFFFFGSFPISGFFQLRLFLCFFQFFSSSASVSLRPHFSSPSLRLYFHFLLGQSFLLLPFDFQRINYFGSPSVLLLFTCPNHLHHFSSIFSKHLLSHLIDFEWWLLFSPSVWIFSLILSNNSFVLQINFYHSLCLFSMFLLHIVKYFQLLHRK